MKKKLLTILVVVILVLSVMSLCFVGCNKSSGGGSETPADNPNPNPDSQPSGDSTVNTEQLRYLESYANAWAVNNAGEEAPEAASCKRLSMASGQLGPTSRRCKSNWPTTSIPSRLRSKITLAKT